MTERERRWDGFCPFDDRPLDATGAEDPCRLNLVVEELRQLVHHALAADGAAPRLRIGLFGGLGQGKTTAVNVLKSRIKADFREQGMRSPSFHDFDVATYRSETLEFELDRLIGRLFVLQWLREKWLYFILALLFLALEAIMVLYAVAVLKSLGFGPFVVGVVTGSAATAAAGLLALPQKLGAWPFLAHWLRDLERWTLQSCFRVSQPGLLVVDNLDRASVTQQKAVLRALYKESSRLHIAVLVVMDETALIGSPPDPEAPEELLRKIIQIECRLPPRTAEDAMHLVVALAEQGRAGNAGRLVEWFLGDVRLLGDWVRILLLLPSVGPRRVKRFVNDLMSTCRQLAVVHPDDVAALSRLLGLYALVPEFRSDAEACISFLAANDEDGLRALWTRLFPAKAKELRPGLERYVRLTRHVQPKDGNWQRLVVQLSGRVGGVPEALLTALRRTGNDYPPSHWRPMPPPPQTGIAEPAPLRSGPLVQPVGREEDFILVDRHPDLAHWPVVEAALVEVSSAAQRLHILRHWHTEITRPHIGLDERRPLLTLLYRTWLGDVEAVALMSEEERRSLVQVGDDALGSGFRRLLLAMPGSSVPIVGRIVVVADPGFGSRDWRSVGPWLADGVRAPGKDPMPSLLPPRQSSNEVAIVSESWPPFRAEAAGVDHRATFQELEWHLVALHQSHKFGIPLTPHALHRALFGRGWLIEQARQNPRRVFDACALLFDLGHHGGMYPEPEPGLWNTSAFDHLVKNATPDLIKVFIDIIARPSVVRGCRDHPKWWLAFYLACLYGDGALNRAWATDIMSGRPCACSDPWLMERLIARTDSPLWDGNSYPPQAILALFGTLLRGSGISGAEPEVCQEYLVDPLTQYLARRADASMILR